MIARGAFDPTLLNPLIGDWSDADRVLLEPATKAIVQRERLAESRTFAPTQS